MKKILTVLLAMSLVVLGAFGLTACGKKSNVVDVTPNTITVGYTVYAPMNYTDDDGIFTGFDTELALRTFNALGYDVMFKLIDWDQKYMELDNETVDCVWNGFTMNSTDEDAEGNVVPRDTLCDFSLPYMKNGQCLFTKSANNITNISELENMSVCYEGGSAGQTAVTTQFVGINILQSAQVDQMAACEAVRNGTKDYAVVDMILANELIANNAGYSDFVVCNIDLGNEYYAIAFKNGSELTAKVNAMLQAFWDTGYIAELAEKYELTAQVVSFGK